MTDDYSKREADDAETMDKLGELYWIQVIEALTPEERKTRTVVVGTRTFTMDDVLHEIRERTPDGRLFLEMHRKARLEEWKGQ